MKKGLVLIMLILLVCTGCGREKTVSGVRNDNQTQRPWEIQKEKATPKVKQGKRINWSIPVNQNMDNSVKFRRSVGETKKSWGLVSCAGDMEHLFVDDSMNHQILHYLKDGSVQKISIPKEMQCYSMTYNGEEQRLYMLLYDCVFPEPAGKVYAEIHLNETIDKKEDDIEIIQKSVPYEYILEENGKLVEEEEPNYEQLQKLESKAAKLSSCKAVNMRRIMRSSDGIDLYEGEIVDSDYEGNHWCMYLVDGNKILEHTEMLDRGSILSGDSNLQGSWLLRENGSLIVGCLIGNDSGKAVDVTYPKLLKSK